MRVGIGWQVSTSNNKRKIKENKDSKLRQKWKARFIMSLNIIIGRLTFYIILSAIYKLKIKKQNGKKRGRDHRFD
jgi:hypothetical protein